MSVKHTKSPEQTLEEKLAILPDPEPMKYHGPGWEMIVHDGEPAEHRYMVWAPQPVGTFVDEATAPRDFWAAGWQGNYGGTGGHTRGPSAEAVLGLFPTLIAEKFRRVIA